MSEMKITLAAPAATDLQAEVAQQFEPALVWVTDSQESYEAGGQMLRSIKAQGKALDERRKAITKPLDIAKKEVMDLFRPALTYLAQAEHKIKHSLLGYEQEQERIRQAELAKAREAARKERERLEARAAKARERGKEERAQALEQAADEVISTPPPVVMPVAEGISKSTTYSAEVMDFDELIKAVAEGKVPRETLLPNTKFLNQMARAMKKNLNYPGVAVVAKQSMRARA